MEKQVPAREVWQRGPVDGVPGLLQPVAHALLQANEEVHVLMEGFPGDLLWKKPVGLASPAFHLQHMSGVIDRLFTYAKGIMLQPLQLEALNQEGVENQEITAEALLNRFDKQVASAIAQLKVTDEKSLTDFRGVGRAQLPSTVIGLLMHAAEHTMRHLGQLIVTVKVLKSNG